MPMTRINSKAPVTTAPPEAQAAALAHRAERIVTDVDGCRVVWRRFGEGQPVVLLHGGHGSWLHWVRNIEVLAAHRAVWAPDMPGFGESDDIASDLSVMTGTLVKGIRQLPGCDGAVSLAGFSFGGLVAANVAASLGTASRLALLGSGGHGGIRRQQRALLDWRQARDAEALAGAMRYNLEAFMIADAAKVDAMAMYAHTESCRLTRFRSKNISRSGDLRDALDRFGGEVLLAWGEHDVTADPVPAIAAMTQGNPRREGRVITNAGHWVQYEAHAPVNALLDGWLPK
ncbi:alpha/beta fold hydrolase [Cupriavidus basilensis]|nr:alpha/beta fold hydrolase [Cupriavidus basilensis]